MSENGKDEKGKGKVKLDVSDYSTLELLTLLGNEEEENEKWLEYFEELLEREPFKGMNETLQDVLTEVEELIRKTDKLLQVFKNHEHLHGSVVVKLG